MGPAAVMPLAGRPTPSNSGTSDSLGVSFSTTIKRGTSSPGGTYLAAATLAAPTPRRSATSARTFAS